MLLLRERSALSTEILSELLADPSAHVRHAAMDVLRQGIGSANPFSLIRSLESRSLPEEAEEVIIASAGAPYRHQASRRTVPP